MTKRLFIQASPRGDRSKSIQVARTYVDALKAANPALQVDALPLRETDLPPFDGDKAAAKINVFLGQERRAALKTAWDQVVEIVSRFLAADHYLFAAPMRNGTIPYRPKHYIDIIHQPGIMFGLKPETGYFGLLKNKHATLVLTSCAYADSRPSPAFGIDPQSTYLKGWHVEGASSTVGRHPIEGDPRRHTVSLLALAGRRHTPARTPWSRSSAITTGRRERRRDARPPMEKASLEHRGLAGALVHPALCHADVGN